MATLTTLVDNTVPVAADFNSNFVALNTEVRGATVGGTGLSAYTTGDLLYASATNTLSARGVGTAGFVLAMVSGVPNWADIAGARFLLRPEGATFPTTNFPALTKNSGTNWVDYTLDFDQTTSEACYFSLLLPSGLTVNAANLDVYSRQAAATSGTIGWTITTLTRADGEAWDTAGAANTVTADAVEGTAGMVHRQTVALTTTGWAADEVLLVKIARDVADTVAEDAKFMAAVLRVR